MAFAGPKQLSEYNPVIALLAEELDNLPPKVIAIDGRDGVGKTTLGRFLAWRFNSTLIETDNFVTGGIPEITYANECLAAVLARRVDANRPVFIDGICVQDILKTMGWQHDIWIYVTPQKARQSTLDDYFLRYDQQYDPMKNATLTVALPAL